VTPRAARHAVNQSLDGCGVRRQRWRSAMTALCNCTADAQRRDSNTQGIASSTRRRPCQPGTVRDQHLVDAGVPVRPVAHVRRCDHLPRPSLTTDDGPRPSPSTQLTAPRQGSDARGTVPPVIGGVQFAVARTVRRTTVGRGQQPQSAPGRAALVQRGDHVANVHRPPLQPVRPCGEASPGPVKGQSTARPRATTVRTRPPESLPDRCETTDKDLHPRWRR